jgi:ComF family protein
VFAAKQDYCGRCISSPQPYDECFCPYQFESPISEQIRDFKYHERPELAKPLAQVLAREISANQLELPDLLVPVPMHLSRLRSRGYNQSARLAQELGKILSIEADYNLLIKTHNTTPQAKLGLNQRSINLKGSFTVKHSVQARKVAIVDDVVTTGATAAEIAKILKRNGVEYVQVWGIAHTV